MPIDDERAAWLKGLAVGDEVAVCRATYSPVILNVARVTASQIVIDEWSGGRFRRDNGLEMCSTDQWVGRAVLHPVTQGRRDRIERDQSIGKLVRVNWHKLTNDQLRRIRAIVDEGATNDNES